ncbi:MAG: hypothetical protein IJR82_05395 [Bacilli bacterium]|nr:hypothetical protein [Bacilli bacterium]
MKKKRVFSLFVLLLLVSIAGVFVAGTYAKYTSSVSRSGSLSVAKWAFNSDNPSGELAIDLNNTVDETSLKSENSDGEKLIAPGTSGRFYIDLSNANSDVGVDFTVKFNNTENIPSNVVFKQENKIIDPANSVLRGQIKAGGSIKFPIDWYWVYSVDNAEDEEDTADGLLSKSMNITASVNAIQVAPGTTVTTNLNN